MRLSDRIGRRIKLHDLHVLMAVAQAGTMSRAAALLNTGQPAISRSIADLEREFGVRLLDRNRQGIKLTEYGRALLDGGTAAFDDLRQMVKKIEYLADPTVGEVRVGCTPFLAATFVSAVIDRLSRQHPRVAFRLVTAYAEALHHELNERNIDLMLARRFGPTMDERLDYMFLFNDPYSFAVSAQNPWARRRKIDLADLVNELWVLSPPETTAGSAVNDAFLACGLGCPCPTVIVESFEMRINLVATGRFISTFPSATLSFFPRRWELKLLPVKQSLNHWPVGVFSLKNRTISPLAQRFIDCFGELAKAKDAAEHTMAPCNR